VRQGIIVAVAALDFVGAKVIFPLAPHAVPEDAEFVAVSTSLSRTVGLSAPEASRADEPLGAVAATPAPTAVLWRWPAAGELVGVKWRCSRLRCGWIACAPAINLAPPCVAHGHPRATAKAPRLPCRSPTR